MQKIATASATFQMGEISRLNRLAERVTEIQTIHKKLDQELTALAAELNHPSPGTENTRQIHANTEPMRHSVHLPAGPRFLPGPVAISIDWAAAGKPYPKQIICERKASDTLRSFFEIIHDRFGQETLERLVAIRANRAPLLSHQPETEFLNPKQGVCYQHQQIGSTGWYVLTHSSTPEKLSIIRQVARALRFPPGAVVVQEVDLKQQMETLFN